MSDHFQSKIRCFCMTRSPAFIRQHKGNSFAERAIRTLEEQLLWVRPSATVDKLHKALAVFAARYNAPWI